MPRDTAVARYSTLAWRATWRPSFKKTQIYGEREHRVVCGPHAMATPSRGVRCAPRSPSPTMVATAKAGSRPYVLNATASVIITQQSTHHRDTAVRRSHLHNQAAQAAQPPPVSSRIFTSCATWGLAWCISLTVPMLYISTMKAIYTAPYGPLQQHPLVFGSLVRYWTFFHASECCRRPKLRGVCMRGHSSD